MESREERELYEEEEGRFWFSEVENGGQQGRPGRDGTGGVLPVR